MKFYNGCIKNNVLFFLAVEAEAEPEPQDYPCKKCAKSDQPEWMLLCDKCDAGWHCSCLRPALLQIPEGDWYCPPCQHVSFASVVKNISNFLKIMLPQFLTA